MNISKILQNLSIAAIVFISGLYFAEKNYNIGILYLILAIQTILLIKSNSWTTKQNFTQRLKQAIGKVNKDVDGIGEKHDSFTDGYEKALKDVLLEIRGKKSMSRYL